MLRMIAAFGFFLLLYTLLNYWIGKRAFQSLFSKIPHVHRIAYWIVYWFIVFSFLLGRLSERIIPPKVSRLLIIIGSYHLAVFVYALLILFIIEIILLLSRFAPLYPRRWKTSEKVPVITASIVCLTIVSTLGYGYWNARHPHVEHYEITIPKKTSQIKQMNVVFVSDIHLGTIIDRKRLETLVELIKQQKPDVLLLPGDIVDEDPGPFVEQKMENVFQRLDIPYGIYGSTGNHEYIGKKSEEIIRELNKAGVMVLRDQAILLHNDVYLIGREDQSSRTIAGKKEKSLSEIMASVDRNKPIILMDHEPNRLEDGIKEGIDLQISGHTHRGQLFPGHLITKQIFEQDWGYLKKGPFQLIVSSGYGTWGPPIRTGCQSEIVDVTITFQ